MSKGDAPQLSVVHPPRRNRKLLVTHTFKYISPLIYHTTNTAYYY